MSSLRISYLWIIVLILSANGQDEKQIPDVVNESNETVNNTCRAGEWYDADSLVCRTLCAQGEVFDEDTKKCTIEVTDLKSDNDTAKAAKTFNRATCKVLKFNKNQYGVKIDEGSVFISPLDKYVKLSDVRISETDDELTTCYNFSYTFMICQRWSLEKDEYNLLDDGLRLFVPDYDRYYEADEFYIRQFPNGSEKDALVCATKSDTIESHKTMVVIYVVCWIVSIVCLLIAFVICVTVHGLRVYHQLLPFYIGSLFVAYLVLTVRTVDLGELSPVICYTYAVLLQFSFLAAFFWLNVLSFDIWRIVSNIRNGHETMQKSCRGLSSYIGYGFGTPLLIVIVTVIVDRHLADHTLQPNFMNACWFQSDKARLVFFYGPIATILVVNVVFFVLTLFNIKAATSQANEGAATRKKHLFQMTFELAVVMGLCWIMEVVSWAAGGDDRYWYVTDVINGLQGLFILIVILRKPAVAKTILARLGIVKRDENNSQLTDVTMHDNKDNPMKTLDNARH